MLLYFNLHNKAMGYPFRVCWKYFMKTLFETRWPRWGNCVESLKAVRYLTGEIYDKIFEFAEQSSDRKARIEVESLCKQLKNFNSTVLIAFWFYKLFKCNNIGKELQNISFDIATAVDNMKHTCK